MPKKKKADWTEPKHMDARDWYALKHIKSLFRKKQYNEALEYARFRCDTIIREEIPPNIWLKMGGQLAPAGWEKLRKLQAKRKKK